MTTQETTDAAEVAAPKVSQRALTIGLCAIVVAIAFETIAVATAMPAAARDLDGLGYYAWAFSGFLIGMLFATVLTGRLSDRIGPAKPLLVGLVIFLAGLQTIPKDLYEAAEVDGANSWERFKGITLPLLRPTMLFAFVITGIGYVQFFEEPYVMTEGGPLNATLSMALYTYNQFGFGNYGYTAAAAFVLFVAIATLTLVQFRLLRDET